MLGSCLNVRVSVNVTGCQMYADVIVYLMWSPNFLVMAYLDDIIGAVTLHERESGFLTFTHLLDHLSLLIK